ncbi:peptidyl-prolyl cis-trans isomerase FKBP62-like isoform X2 [Xenia sp. Carnegie-2017]|uniref:peptidyl-prolyl cis-trans isomerase FKBP62-like isoform X2 n=1 Tax=Xenia sp. Carnegie-2017 TaxID=2897299 RepID=UPI001F036D8B|nr:peptidyl-prolyl cis-trans isomerase FKBP62-like isoform X2 [Xenia sp. Carnegie-2017]
MIDLGRQQFFVINILQQGSGVECPQDGSRCLIEVTLSQGDKVLFERTNIKWCIGEGDVVSEYVNECLESMHCGDICQLSIKPNVDLQEPFLKGVIAKNLSLHYEIKLTSFTEVKNSWEFSFEERWLFALRHKEMGKTFYHMGKWLLAARHYSKATKSLIFAQQHHTETNNDEFCTLKLQCYLNLAACQLKLQRYTHVLENSTKALSIDKCNVKALFRRAQAYMAQKDFVEASHDIKKAQMIAPRNSEIIQLQKKLKQKIKEHEDHMTKNLERMFNN